MNTGLRKEKDGDLIESYVSVTDYMTDHNQHVINCSDCAKTFYADASTCEGIVRAIEQGLDNPFICIDCQQEYEELANSAR